jgi:hypothetical protein
MNEIIQRIKSNSRFIAKDQTLSSLLSSKTLE